MGTKGVPRRWDLDAQGLRRIGSKESGFTYETSTGQPVGDRKNLGRIARLRIPPAWQNVRIAPGEGAPLQAIGVDRKGRTQYLYHSRFRARKEEEKFLRVVEFGESLPHLRRKVRADLARNNMGRERVLGAIVRLIDQGFFRVGNDKSAKYEETYGLTTVLGDHVRVSGTRIHFDFVGKWQRSHRRAIDDAEVAAVVRQLRRIEGAELFKFVQNGRVVDVKDRHVNEYIQSIIGEGFTAKDFRTWAGTLICSMALANEGQAASKTERKRRIKRSIQATADLLGNTPAVCRMSYICPRLLHEYMEGKPFELRRRSPQGHPVARLSHSREEKALLRFLRETIADRRGRPRRA
jgi:DNA topoisomerase-1